MEATIPRHLQPGDHVRVIAPSHSLAVITPENSERAKQRLEALGLRVSFSDHSAENDIFRSSSIESRIADLHAAWNDPDVAGVIAVIGGYNANQLLRQIDWDLLRNHPKPFCGFSDITALSNAMLAKSGVISYSGPSFINFAPAQMVDYTIDMFRCCVMQDEPFEILPAAEWSDDRLSQGEPFQPITNPGYSVLHEGEARGTIIGGNLCTLNLLQGTEYFPQVADDLILFIEDDYESHPLTFDRDLQSLLHALDPATLRGVVIGRFQKKSEMTPEKLALIIETKAELRGVPVIAGADFGHTKPLFTFPIGGTGSFRAVDGNVTLCIERH